jgi:hypothetical protein
VKTALGNQFLKMAGTIFANTERFVGKILNCFFYCAALGAFIFINRHIDILLK